jgi:hypothetical protein
METVSGSSLTITWLKPDIEEEQWEFFKHPEKQSYYRQHQVLWPDIISAFDCGKLLEYPRSDRIGEISVSLSYHTYDDYSRYLAKAKRGYRISYSRMENQLQRNGGLTLKAPIILTTGNEGLLFSGYRRLCLSWNYGIVPYVWLVNLDRTGNNNENPADHAAKKEEILWENSCI